MKINAESSAPVSVAPWMHFCPKVPGRNRRPGAMILVKVERCSHCGRTLEELQAEVADNA